MPVLSQLGWKKETTVGTAVTPDRFIPFASEEIKTKVGRHRAPVLRASGFGQRQDATAAWVEGASGTIAFPVPSKTFASLLEVLLGSVATTGPAESVVYTHTATPASLRGKALTIQANRADQGDANRPFTWAGCKFTEWSLSSGVDGVLEFEATVDALSETTATSLATASYASGSELFPWTGCSLSIGGSAVPVSDVKVSVNLGLETSRKRLRSSAQPIEQVASELIEVTFECTTDFDSLTHYNRVASSTVAGSVAEVVVTWQGSVIGTTLRNQVQATMPAVQFDEGFPAVSGTGPIQVPLKGTALFDGTNPVITLAVQSTESTP